MRQNEDVIALYSRKSKFTGKGESIGNQVELGKEDVRDFLELPSPVRTKPWKMRDFPEGI